MREFCNKASEGVYYHGGKCDDSKNTFLLKEAIAIHIYNHSEEDTVWIAKNGITTVANAMDQDNEYYL